MNNHCSYDIMGAKLQIIYQKQSVFHKKTSYIRSLIRIYYCPPNYNVLEHGRLNVVAFALFFWRKALDLLPKQICLDVLVVEVAPAGLALPWDAPPPSCSLPGDGLDALLAFGKQRLE